MAGVDMSDCPAAEQAAHLARTLAGLRDPSIQVGWLRKQLLALGAARAADVLTVVLARAEQREERYAALLLRVSLALAAPETDSFRRAVAGLAHVRDQRSLARFLGAGEPEPGVTAESQDSDEASPRSPAGRVPDFGKGRPLTLGERKSIARRRDKALLDRVLRDPHPDVIRIVLDNPVIREEDVVRLSALRPVGPEVLLAVFRHARWVIHYRVQNALAQNPYTPEAVAIQLVPHLSPVDRRELAHASHASCRLREACGHGFDEDKPLH